MRTLRSVAILALLVCLLPVASVFIAGTVASLNGCVLHEGGVNPCVILGVDWGETLYTMGVMGWLALATLPIAVGVGALWVVIEGGNAVLKWRKRAAVASRPAEPSA